jgi:hypothetical protein
MQEKKPSENKRYNTNELLSLNIDRLKEYMKRLGKEASNPQGMPVLEVSSPRPKPSTRIGKRPADCRCLAVFPDPFLFVQIVALNDKRPPGQRYAFDRASSSREAVERMKRQAYDLVMIAPFQEAIQEGDAKFGAADLILLLHQQMRHSDLYFLAKKRWFVMNAFAGADNAEKVESFHGLRDAYQNIPFIYVAENPAEEDAVFLASARKVRVFQRSAGALDGLFRILDDITLGSSG